MRIPDIADLDLNSVEPLAEVPLTEIEVVSKVCPLLPNNSI
jgi:hypothetical protein